MWSYCEEYPGADIFELPQPGFLKNTCSVYCQKFEIGGQTGTYIETRAHVDKSARPVSEIRADRFFKNCKIIRLKRKKKSERITVEEIKRSAPRIKAGDAVLIHTGWDEKWDDKNFVEHSPFISKEAAEWLIGKGINLLGADFPRFDNVKSPEFPWGLFWDKVEFVLAPVVNLQNVRGDAVKLISLPLKIRGAVSTPTRAVVIEP